jgi:hypothetical protein
MEFVIYGHPKRQEARFLIFLLALLAHDGDLSICPASLSFQNLKGPKVVCISPDLHLDVPERNDISCCSARLQAQASSRVDR